MPDEDKNFVGSLALDLRIWWCHMKNYEFSDPVSDGATKTANFEYWTGRAELTVWARCCEYLCDTGLKKSKF